MTAGKERTMTADKERIKELTRLCDKLFSQNTKLMAVCEKWADIIQGGDSFKQLEPWAQECVTDLRSQVK